MSKILVLAEQKDGKLKSASLEIISAAAAAGHEVHAALLGQGVDSLAGELGSFGAAQVHIAQDSNLENYCAEAYVKVLGPLLQSIAPDFFLAAHSPLGRDLAPHLSARLEAGLATDCNSAEFSADGLKLRRPVYAGKATAEVEFVGSGLKMATIRPNTLGTPQNQSGAGTANTVAVDIGELKAKVTELVKGQMERPDVSEAAIVVSGGRSLKNSENFSILETMADTIGAAVGASRAAVDAGYRPHRDQVGQTGKVVSPSLYIACGISGAIQHLAGMRTSKTIVAINTDPEAPIFKVADYGIVGDLFEVVPLLTEEFKKIKES